MDLKTGEEQLVHRNLTFSFIIWKHGAVNVTSSEILSHVTDGGSALEVERERNYQR